MKSLIKVSAIAVLLFSLSCKKKSDDTPEPTPQPSAVCLVTTVKQGSVNIQKITYNSNRKVTRLEQRRADNTLESVIDYEYSGALLSKQTTTNYLDNGTTPDETTYTYYEYNSSGKLTKQIQKDQAGTSLGYTEYSYNSSGQVSKGQNYSIESGTPEPAGYQMYEYLGGKLASITNWTVADIKTSINRYDANENMISMGIFDENGVEHIVMTNEFDTSKPNYIKASFSQLTVIAGGVTPKNAVTKTRVYREDGSIEGETTYAYSDYNTQGMPTTVTVNDNSSISILKLEYSCN